MLFVLVVLSSLRITCAATVDVASVCQTCALRGEICASIGAGIAPEVAGVACFRSAEAACDRVCPCRHRCRVVDVSTRGDNAIVVACGDACDGLRCHKGYVCRARFLYFATCEPLVKYGFCQATGGKERRRAPFGLRRRLGHHHRVPPIGFPSEKKSTFCSFSCSSDADCPGAHKCCQRAIGPGR